MNRIGNLYEKVCSINNLELADKKASRGKAKQPGVIIHRLNKQQNIWQLHETLKSKTYKTSKYSIFKIYERKEREIHRLPYYPDRIVHHAIMNVIEPILVSTFTADTYSCIKGRGIHSASYKMRKVMKDVEGTKYCLKLDIKKFYENINHEVLKQLLRKKFKDKDLLWLLDEIIDSAQGVPIGNYLSQNFANFYLTFFDHWIKEELRVKYYFRYCDDIVIFDSSKDRLRQLLADIRGYVNDKLILGIKSNYQIFLVEGRGVDFVGYKHFHTHVLLRNSIKKRFIRKLATDPNEQSIAAYKGWLDHCDSINLKRKYLTQAPPPF
jgi:RNA-directed DNA polymerase